MPTCLRGEGKEGLGCKGVMERLTSSDCDFPVSYPMVIVLSYF